MQIMKYSQNVQRLVFLVIVSILVVSCNSDGPEIEQPEKIYYDLAQKRMENKNFIGAIESLEAIVQQNHCLLYLSGGILVSWFIQTLGVL